MNSDFDLEKYLSRGVEDIVKGAIKASFKNPKESIFIAKFAVSSKEAEKIRKGHEQKGEHIPPFLIASITNSCNLHCKGCYARANHSCDDSSTAKMLTATDWKKIFREAEELGICFILLAGGEPLLREDVILTAADFRKIIFPVFTNGTLLNESYLKLFDQNRNLIPVLSIEGNESFTDERRGEGVYLGLMNKMELLKKKGIIYGASITITKENIQEVTAASFIDQLHNIGCRVVIMVEYVPVNSDTKELAPTDQEREYLENALMDLRNKYEDMIMISFPGDEKTVGGCLAGGRGFFHINAVGGTEPCPFSPYSDTNIKNTTVLEALNSPLLKKIRNSEVLMSEHEGGCVLFEYDEEVKKLMQ